MEQYEFRAVIKHFYLEGLTATETNARLVAVHGANAPSFTMVKKWFANFKRGEMSTSDAPRSGRPKTASDENSVKLVEQMVHEDRRVSTRTIAKSLKISKGTVGTILSEVLCMKKLKSKMVQRQLTDEQKSLRLELSLANLKHLKQDSDFFWKRFMTVDETWLQHFTAEDSESSRQWTASGEQHPTSTRKGSSAGKVMAAVFWNTTGIVFIDYLPKNTTMTGNYYAALLDKLNNKLRESRPDLRNTTLLLHHDNAPAHKSAQVLQKLHDLNFETVPHPPYSPDLAPSDYCLFGNLKKHLPGKNFSSDEGVMAEVELYFDSENSDFFLNGIKAIEDRWKRCVDLLGDYIE